MTQEMECGWLREFVGAFANANGLEECRKAKVQVGLRVKHEESKGDALLLSPPKRTHIGPVAAVTNQ